MRVASYFLVLWVGFVIGRQSGHRDGIAQVKFDKHLANKKLQHCLRIVRE